MGLFEKVTCGCCGNECGIKRFKLKKSDEWICAECLKKAGGITTIDVSKVTIEEIRQIINDKEQVTEEKRLHSTTGLVTAEDMYNYCKDNGYGKGVTTGWGIKHFKLIEDSLMSGEEVLMTFIGIHNYVSTSENDGHYAYAITNKRIIMAQKGAIGENLQTVYLTNVNDITFSCNLLFGLMTIDTIKEKFNVYLDKSAAKLINTKVHEVLDELLHSQSKQSAPIENNTVSNADEILKYKELLDSGIITSEEFDAKKKQLLGI